MKSWAMVECLAVAGAGFLFLTCLGLAAVVAVLVILNRPEEPQFPPVQAPELGPEVAQALRGKPPLGVGAKARRADQLRPDEPAT